MKLLFNNNKRSGYSNIKEICNQVVFTEFTAISLVLATQSGMSSQVPGTTEAWRRSWELRPSVKSLYDWTIYSYILTHIWFRGLTCWMWGMPAKLPSIMKEDATGGSVTWGSKCKGWLSPEWDQENLRRQMELYTHTHTHITFPKIQ